MNDTKKLYSKKELLDLLIGYNIITVNVEGRDFRFYRAGHPTACKSEMFCEDFGDHVSGAAGMDEAKRLVDEICVIQKYVESCQISISYVGKVTQEG